MKFCHKCGAQCEDAAKFCKQCGAKLADVNAGQNQQTYEVPPQPQYTENHNQNTYGNQNSYSNQNNYGNQNAYGNPNNYGGPAGGMNQRFPGIQPRNIAISVILSIVTCGIYGLYWMIKLNDEINQISGDTQATGGGMVLLFTLITCGIYGWYWMYKMGEKCDQIKGVNGSSGILYLILGIFGLGIVNYCLMQDTINKAIA